MNELVNTNIENMIYEIRGKQVMLDSDLARLYHVETKRINEAVRRNTEKFPERFSWILTYEESKDFLVANCDQKNETRGGRYKNPRVFTEQGVAMLATILKSKTAIDVSIAIMDAFVSMRHFIIENKDIYKSLNYINNKITDHDSKINYLFSKFDNKNKLSNTIINSYKKEYGNLKVYYSDHFHDRYFVVDRKDYYLCGTSINYIGSSASTIIRIEDDFIIDKLRGEIEVLFKLKRS